MAYNYLNKVGLTNLWGNIKAYITSKLSSKAEDNSVVHLTGDETINGTKTFTSDTNLTGTTTYISSSASQYNKAIVIKNTKCNKNDTISQEEYDTLSFVGNDYNGSYSTIIAQLRTIRYADTDTTYSGNNAIEFRVSSNTNTTFSGMKAMVLRSDGSASWCGNDLLTTATGVLSSAIDHTGIGLSDYAKSMGSVDFNTCLTQGLFSTYSTGSSNYPVKSPGLLQVYKTVATAKGVQLFYPNNNAYKNSIFFRSWDYNTTTSSTEFTDWNEVLTNTTGVNLTSSQTITGKKYFTADVSRKITSLERAVTPETNTFGSFVFVDNNNLDLAYLRFASRTYGKRELNLFVKDSEGTVYGIDIATDKTVVPNENNTYFLGTPKDKWNNVYSTTFTGDLVGTADRATSDSSGNTITSTYATKVENSTKANSSAVVHLTGNETINGTKTFSAVKFNISAADIAAIIV